MQLKKFIHEFQDKNPEKFNKELMEMKDKDDVLILIKDWAKSLEIIDGLTFMGAEIISTDKVYNYYIPKKKPKRRTKEEIEKEKENLENGIVQEKKVEEENNKLPFREINLEESRFIEIEIKFHIEKDGEEKDITKKLYFPELLDHFSFLINGVSYYPIYQLFDAECYRTKKSIVQKTALQPIVLMFNDVVVKDIDNTYEFSNKSIYSKLFDTRVPIFVYYFAKFGIEETIKFFNFPFTISGTSNSNGEDEIEFKLSKTIFLNVKKNWIEQEEINEILLLTFLDTFKKSSRLIMEQIMDKEFWIRRLGGNFTKNTSNHYNKGISVQYSLERLMDETTKRISRIPENNKKDVYHLIRWMLFNFLNISRMNNMTLANKRLRVNEYLLFPLYEKSTKGILRLLNGKNNDIKKICSIFSTIHKGFLVDKCVNSDIMRYNNLVNSIDFTSMLKITNQGPQSISNSKGEVRGRGLHESMIGNIDLVYTSNSDPGCSRMLTPFAKVLDNGFFTKEPDLKMQSSDNDDDI